MTERQPIPDENGNVIYGNSLWPDRKPVHDDTTPMWTWHVVAFALFVLTVFTIGLLVGLAVAR